MANTKVSPSLQQTIDKATSGSISTLFSIECIFLHPTASLKLGVIDLVDIKIMQNFADAAMDQVQISVRLSPTDYKTLLKNMQDLEVALIFYPVDAQGIKLDDGDTIVLEAVCFMPQQVEIDKVISPDVLADDDVGNEDSNVTYHTPAQAGAYTTLDLILLTKEQQTARQQSQNCMLGGDMQTILQYAASQLKPEKCYIVPPDNPETFGSGDLGPCILEADSNFSNIGNRLQKTYGVYAKGCCYYYDLSRKAIYIYPKFETDPNKSAVPGVIHLVSAPNYALTGNGSNHKKIDNDIYIFSSSQVQDQPLTTLGNEELGKIVVNKSDMTTDRSSPVQEDGTVKRNTEETQVILTPQNKAADMSSSVQKTTYVGTATNIYQYTELMAATNGSIFNLTWNMARPWLLQPGQNVLLHHDGAQRNYTTQQGRLMGCNYFSHVVGPNDPHHNLYTFTCGIVVFLEPDKKSDEEVQY